MRSTPFVTRAHDPPMYSQLCRAGGMAVGARSASVSADKDAHARTPPPISVPKLTTDNRTIRPRAHEFLRLARIPPTITAMDSMGRRTVSLAKRRERRCKAWGCRTAGL